jgi:hypothetical protein
MKSPLVWAVVFGILVVPPLSTTVVEDRAARL